MIPKNWEHFQHYKDRSPPWIKLHKALLDDRVFQRLPDASRALAPCLWLLASEGDGGVFDGSVEEIAFRVRQSERWVRDALRPLIDNSFFIVIGNTEQDASNPLAEGLRDACLETETETETEKKPLAGKPAVAKFEDFYAAYPRKVKPLAARKAWDKLKPTPELLARMLRAIAEQKKSPQWLKDGGQFIPYPATWLNAGEWDNQVAVETSAPAVDTWKPPPALTPDELAAAAETRKRVMPALKRVAG